MKYTLLIACIFLIGINSDAQNSLPNNSIGISFLQLQPDNDSWYLRFTPIFNLGISYEHKIAEKYTLNVEGILKLGIDRVGCIDCPGASGKMTELNLKAGVNRYFNLNKKVNLFGQLQIFREITNVPNGKSNFSVIGGQYRDWFRKVKYTGFEISAGMEYNIFSSISLYLNPSLQYGKYYDLNSIWERGGFWLFNFSVLENFGMKYKF